MASVYNLAVLADAPATYYRVDEAAGTSVVDSSGNSHTGTYHTTFTLQQAGAIPQDTDAAVKLTGGYITAGTTTLSGTAFSVELWFNLTSNSFGSSFPGLVTSDATAVNHKGIEIILAPVSDGHSGYVTLGNGSSHVSTAFGNGVFPTGFWYHLVVTYNGTTMTVYLNGGPLVVSTAFSGSVTAGVGPITVGAYVGGTTTAPTFVDEIAIYSTTLSAARVQAHYAAAFTPWGYPLSNLVYKSQMVYVYTSASVFIDVWRDAPLLSGFKEAIDAATSSMRVQLPRSWDNFDLYGAPGSRGTVRQGNIVKYYLYGPGLPTTGLLRYQGIIDSYEPSIAEDGQECVIITILPQSSAIADRGLGPSVTFTTTDPITQFNYWFTTTDSITGVHYLNPLTLDPSNPASSGVSVTYTWTNQTIDSIFATILQMLSGAWFFRCNPDLTVTMNQTPVTAQHTLVVGQHVTAPTYREDWSTLKNVIYYTGYTPTAGGLPIYVVATGSDLSTFGERIALLNDSRVQNTTPLTTLANGALAILDQVNVRATCRVIDYRGDAQSGLGYDIETLKVGDSCVIIDATSTAVPSTVPTAVWDTAIWDTDLWPAAATAGTPIGTVVSIVSIAYNYDYVDLELGSLQPSQDKRLLEIQKQLQDFTMI